METVRAQFADEEDNIEFPPQRKMKKPLAFGGSGTGYLFETNVLVGNSALLSAVNELFEEYKRLEQSSREELLAQLEAETDELIEGAQRAKARLQDNENQLLEEMRRHQKAKDKLANVTEEYRQIVEHIENAEGLFTRAQQAKRESQREEARQRLNKVSMEESLATTALNNAIHRKNQASVAAAEWTNSAHQLQSQLKALKRGRKEDHLHTGFQPV